MYLLVHCHHQNDSCIKMGSDESHFNVSLIVRAKVTRQCPQTTTKVHALALQAIHPAVDIPDGCGDVGGGESRLTSFPVPQLLKRKDNRSGIEPRSLCLPA